MKKLISLALTLFLTLTLLCAGAFAEADDHSGDWYADLYGFTLRLTLNPDPNDQDVQKQIQAYKDLLDCGILTQEECEQKIRELTQEYYGG